MELREDGKVLVAAGSVKLVVAPEDLVMLEEPVRAAGAEPHREKSTPIGPRSAPRTEVDLRGMRVAEAEAATLTALDAAVLE
jgi:dsDNA-specific endonuclease/ATPase MutS2